MVVRGVTGVKCLGATMLIGLSVAVLCTGQEQPHPRILRPVDRSILAAVPFSVIARASAQAELRLDGKSVAIVRPAADVLTATLFGPPGLHELALLTPAGEHKLSFFVARLSEGAGAPQDWKSYRVHPPAAACDMCHVVMAGAWTIKGGSVSKNCFSCHDLKEFEQLHTAVLRPLPDSHDMDNLSRCQRCHDPHGSQERAHLKAPAEIGCRVCHQ
jgi:predicted CXXCH cytochrome family protein